MGVKSPEEVLRAVSSDIKARGYTHEQAAKKLGFGSKQTLSNLLASKRYMSAFQAKKFVDNLGYNMDFLTSGKGDLQPYHGVHGSTPLGEVSRKYGMETFTIIDGTPEGERDMILGWFHDYFEIQDDEKGMMLWAQIVRYTQAEAIIQQQMKTYKEDNYAFEYEERLTNFQVSVIEKIDKMLRDLQKENAGQ